MTATITAHARQGLGRLRYDTPRFGTRIVVAAPAEEPGLWREYMHGAERAYERHGVGGVLDIDQVIGGESTSLFFAALHPDGALVGGMRSQGPYVTPDQSHALAEWDGDPARPIVQAMIEDRLPFGVVESKTAWVADGFPGRRELVATLSRAPLHAAMILGARFALGTSGAHSLPMWMGTGATVPNGLSTTGYPDDRYMTHLLWWDRWALPATVTEEHKRALDLETAQLLRPAAPAHAA